MGGFTPASNVAHGIAFGARVGYLQTSGWAITVEGVVPGARAVRRGRRDRSRPTAGNYWSTARRPPARFSPSHARLRPLRARTGHRISGSGVDRLRRAIPEPDQI